MPEIIPQLGPENVAMLKEIASQMRMAQEQAGGAPGEDVGGH